MRHKAFWALVVLAVLVIFTLWLSAWLSVDRSQKFVEQDTSDPTPAPTDAKTARAKAKERVEAGKKVKAMRAPLFLTNAPEDDVLRAGAFYEMLHGATIGGHPIRCDAVTSANPRGADELAKAVWVVWCNPGYAYKVGISRKGDVVYVKQVSP